MYVCMYVCIYVIVPKPLALLFWGRKFFDLCKKPNPASLYLGRFATMTQKFERRRPRNTEERGREQGTRINLLGLFPAVLCWVFAPPTALFIKVRPTFTNGMLIPAVAPIIRNHRVYPTKALHLRVCVCVHEY